MKFCHLHIIPVGDEMKTLKRYSMLGVLFVWIVGTIWHFVYEWSGNNRILGLIFPVNESVWEHMKLIFFPMLLYALYMKQKLKNTFPCIGSALLTGILTGTFLIPVIFYTYTGILGKNNIVLDVATFLCSVVSAFLVVYRLTLSCKTDRDKFLLKLAVCMIAVCFFVFTYNPPELGIFEDPTRMVYGIIKAPGFRCFWKSR